MSRYALMWSGGKDSALALARARASGIEVAALLNFVDPVSRRVRFHATRASLVADQAAAAGLPLRQHAVAWQDFERAFRDVLTQLRSEGFAGLVLGNIHLADVRGWYEERVRAAGLMRISDGSLERIAAQGIPVLVIDARSVADIARMAITLGTATGTDGTAVAREIERGIAAVRSRTATITRRRVFHEVDATDPTKLFTAGPGSFINELIELAGGINVAARAASAWPQLSAEEVISADPEVIVLGNAMYGVTADQVAARPGWSVTTAVRTRRIVAADPSLFHRPGPRIVRAAEEYQKIVSDTR